MLNLTRRYANALLEYAEDNGLELVYRQALAVVLGGKEAPEELAKFLSQVPASESIPDIIYTFLDLARDRMDLLECEIISAVPLRPKQLAALETKLIYMVKKQLDITQTVDPEVLGGVRVIVGNVILDDTIRRRLVNMKKRIYEGVYFKE